MVPAKTRISEIFHRVKYALLSKLPLPKVNPSVVSFITVGISLLALFFRLSHPYLFFLLLALAWTLDGLDGVIAQKYGLESREGYLYDTLCDRLCEGIVFVWFFLPWFPLFALNTYLTLRSLHTGKHHILPLRLYFIIYYAVFFLR